MGFIGKVYETIRNKVWENTALSNLHETFRSKARDHICAALKEIGVDAEMAVLSYSTTNLNLFLMVQMNGKAQRDFGRLSSEVMDNQTSDLKVDRLRTFYLREVFVR